MMDNVVDVSRFPLDEQRREAVAKRRIGLGVTGLADALIMMKARYGDERSLALADGWLRRLKRQAYLASVRLAREKGPFPLFDRDAWLGCEGTASLDEDVRAAVRRHGIRNALLTSIAPTGTISLFADNVSSGLEPVFAFSYTRNVLMPDGSRRAEEVADYAVRLYRRLHGPDAPLPDWFVDAGGLAPADHVAMQAAVQKHVDSSISKTVNVPEDIPFRGLPRRLHAGLGERLQGLHHLPSQRRHRGGAGGAGEGRRGPGAAAARRAAGDRAGATSARPPA